MSEPLNLKARAVAVYAESELFKADIEKRAAELAALQILFKELGVEFEPDQNFIEVEGVTIIATYGGVLLGDIRVPSMMGRQDEPSYTYRGVSIQAHTKCPLCGEMRHSETFEVSEFYPGEGAAKLGRFLIENHLCPTKPDGRKVGLRPSQTSAENQTKDTST